MDSSSSGGKAAALKRSHRESDTSGVPTPPADPNCGCIYCSGVNTESGQAEMKGHDQWIGWPSPLCLPAGSREFPLTLVGYTRSERDDIVRALMTLAKHDVGPAELARGIAVGRHADRDPKEEFIAKASAQGENFNLGDSIGGTHYYKDHFINALKLNRVGANFVDYEVSRHKFGRADIMFGENFQLVDEDEKRERDRQLEEAGEWWRIWPARRAREMGTEGVNDPANRLIRLFPNDDYDQYHQEDSLLSTVRALERMTYYDWIDEAKEKMGSDWPKKKRRDSDSELSAHGGVKSKTGRVANKS